MDPAAIVRRSARMHARNVAVWVDGRELSYADMFERACRLANLLRELGATPGDRVAVLGDNAFESVEQAAGCALGAFVRTVLYTYHAPAINRYLLELTGTRILMVQARYFTALQPQLDGLQNLKAVIVFGGDAPPGTLAYDSAVGASPAKDPNLPVQPDDIHIIRFSSGTTGRPKGIYHTIARWMAYTEEYRSTTPLLTEHSRYLVPTSLAHLGIALLWGSLAVGGRIAPMPSFQPGHTLDLLESQRITHTAVAPIMIREMLADPSARERDFSALQCMIYAGSPIAPATLRTALEVFGPCMFQLYAQSEAMPITMLLGHQHVVEGTPAELARMRSVGRATPNVEVSVRDDAGAVVAPGVIGEVATRGPATMSGLWNDPEGTARRLLPDGSVLTRDMGYMDEDGFVYLVDRKDDMIVSGGFNIWPTELELALSSHPAVADACVFGVPDPKWGETPRAVVVLRAGASATAGELMAHTRALVGGVKKITSIEFADALPRTATGKVQRNVLRDPWWKDRASRIAGS